MGTRASITLFIFTRSPSTGTPSVGGRALHNPTAKSHRTFNIYHVTCDTITREHENMILS